MIRLNEIHAPDLLGVTIPAEAEEDVFTQTESEKGSEPVKFIFSEFSTLTKGGFGGNPFKDRALCALPNLSGTNDPPCIVPS